MSRKVVSQEESNSKRVENPHHIFKKYISSLGGFKTGRA
jgi:hypothetical protein